MPAQADGGHLMGEGSFAKRARSLYGAYGEGRKLVACGRKKRLGSSRRRSHNATPRALCLPPEHESCPVIAGYLASVARDRAVPGRRNRYSANPVEASRPLDVLSVGGARAARPVHTLLPCLCCASIGALVTSLIAGSRFYGSCCNLRRLPDCALTPACPICRSFTEPALRIYLR